jgi:hypothetical protein
MADHKLVLHPQNPRAILQDPPELLESLRQLRLIGPSFNHLGELHHRAGPRFLDLVLFKEGVTPPEGEDACHVGLSETTEDPIFLGGGNAQAPSCPGCGHRFDRWREKLQEWRIAQEVSWVCSSCGRQRKAHELDWGRRGGFARYALDVWNVKGDEAVPSAELLELLRVISYEDWTYFYYRFP